jgi:DNA-binding response OmpR family regulator
MQGVFAKDPQKMFSPAEILLVEDEPDIIDFMERILRRAGHSVCVVMDGVAALAALADDPPDIMILDLVLPRMSGWAVLEHLHRDQYHIPVIIMTANPIVSSRLSSYGIKQYLVKPFLMDELLDAIAEVYPAQLHR